MAEWSEDYEAAIGPLKHELWNFGRLWLNWRPGGARRRKGKTIGSEGRGVVCGKATPSRL
jgi:hypothetical protein